MGRRRRGGIQLGGVVRGFVHCLCSCCFTRILTGLRRLLLHLLFRRLLVLGVRLTLPLRGAGDYSGRCLYLLKLSVQ